MATDLPGWVKSGAESARDKARASALESKPYGAVAFE